MPGQHLDPYLGIAVQQQPDQLLTDRAGGADDTDNIFTRAHDG